MKIIGIEANIGSMLYPFQEAGHEVVGNYDSRGIINEENYSANFPDSVLFPTLEKMEEYVASHEIDVVMSQPSCSKYSNLSRKDEDDYEECINIWFWFAKIKPKFFFVESKLDYINEVARVPGYKYHFEWVSNFGYGNTQKGRNRLWVIGIREDQDWRFISNEQQHSNTVEQVIAGLPSYDIPAIDHVHIFKPLFKDSTTKEYMTLDETFAMLLADGRLSYKASDGETKNRINRRIANRVHSTTITGGGTWFHWEKKYPLTVREKARIQGFPDTFSFQGLSNTKKDKAVGKSIPFEFTTYLVALLDGRIKPEKPSKVVPEPPKLTIIKNSRFYDILASK